MVFFPLLTAFCRHDTIWGGIEREGWRRKSGCPDRRKERAMVRYTPSPVNTENVVLSAELEELIEHLAKNTHEVWAQQRMKDGWIYGPNRDDDKKAHPDLVAYEELPESEKEYDRSVAEQLIKSMLAMGYRITK